MLPEGPLLEREAELARLDAAIAAGRVGDAPMLVIRGAAGIGKTSLLDAAVARAQRSGVTVLAARGGAMERDLVFGVVAQLLERRVFGADEDERARLLSGPARLAAEALHPGARTDGAPHELGALNHGLYWLIGNLAERGPLLFVVDDAHWADAASLQFLLHLARRRAGLPIAILVGTRSDEPDPAAVLDRILAEPGVEVIEPPVLTVAAATVLLGQRAGTAPGPEAARAAHEVTGGNPFFLGEIGAALRTRPHDAQSTVTLIRSLVPSAVRHALLLRLGRLGPSARATAEALAVLGDDAAVDDVGAVADCPRDGVLAALAQLAESGLCATHTVTRFGHPIIRTAILSDLSAPRRALLHERAARALAARGAEAERVAHHLLGAEPAGRGHDAEILAAAGSAALIRGDAATAVSLLVRAVAEPPSAEAIGRVRLELGRGRMALADPTGAVEDLEIGLRASSDPGQRVEIAVQLADALAGADRIDAAVEVLDAARAHAQADDALRLGVHRAALSLFDPARAVAAQRQMLDYASLAGDTPAQRGALANAAIASAFTPSARAKDVIAIARRALGNGQLIADGLAPSVGCGPPIYALLLGGDLEAGDRELRHVQARARERGSAIDGLIYEDLRLEVCRQRGELGLAAAHGVATLGLAREWGDHAVALRVLSLAACWLVEVFIEQGKPDLARETIASLEAEHDLRSRPELVWARQARAMIALFEGRPDDAWNDLAAVETIARTVGYEDRTASWRPWAARALAALGQNDRALELVAEELALCRTWGAPMPLSAALRTTATLGDPAAARDHLREAAALLHGTPHALEVARVATDLGIAERREGQRTAARESLARGADAAVACGALATAQRARAELVLLGARPRRLRLRGVDALTPSELRVASLAATGLSNRRISQELFVSPKTVESHLGRVYGKLDVPGRAGLAAALAG